MAQARETTLMCRGCYVEGPAGLDAYRRKEHFADLYPDARWSPGHIVIDDDNLEDGHIIACLTGWDRCVREGQEAEMLAAAWCWLKYMLTIPERKRYHRKDGRRLTERVTRAERESWLDRHRYAGAA